MKQLWTSLGLVALLAMWTASASSLQAQGSGVITGTVKGPSGPIAALTVNVVNDAGTVVGTAVTTQAGTYSFSNLAFGTYTIQVLNAERRVVATGVGTLSGAASTATVDLTLTDSRRTAAAVAAGEGEGGMSTTTKVVIATAVAAAAGIAVIVATRADSSPTR